MGYTHIPVNNVDEIFSFVRRIESLRSLLVLITLEDRHKSIVRSVTLNGKRTGRG